MSKTTTHEVNGRLNGLFGEPEVNVETPQQAKAGTDGGDLETVVITDPVGGGHRFDKVKRFGWKVIDSPARSA